MTVDLEWHKVANGRNLGRIAINVRDDIYQVRTTIETNP